MSDKRKSLDLWIVETNTVYREVPYSVVTDWVQQGRLLEEDRVRLAGGNDWKRLGDVSGLAAFLPRVEPMRVEDEAEALEPVEVDFAWKKRHDDDDDDVDMIPLIDVSLVLLIFFMLTSTVGRMAALIDTPKARYKLLSISSDMVWVGVKPGEDGKTVYLFGKKEGDEGVAYADRNSLVNALAAHLKTETQPVKVNIKAHKNLPFDVIRDLTADLESLKRTGMVVGVFTEVSGEDS
jgi:biopolymer transport protein ExbD